MAENEDNKITKEISYTMGQYKEIMREFEIKLDSVKSDNIKETRKYLTLSSSIIGVGVTVISTAMIFNSYSQYLSISSIKDHSKNVIDDYHIKFSDLERTTKDQIEAFIGARNLKKVEILSYDEHSDSLTAFRGDTTNKYEDYNIYSISLVVSIRIKAEKEFVGQMLGIHYKLSEDIATILANQNGKLIKSQYSVMTNYKYVSADNLFFDGYTPSGFQFFINGLTNNCKEYKDIRAKLIEKNTQSKIYIKPLVKNFAGEPLEKEFILNIDSTNVSTECQLVKKEQ